MKTQFLMVIMYFPCTLMGKKSKLENKRMSATLGISDLRNYAVGIRNTFRKPLTTIVRDFDD